MCFDELLHLAESIYSGNDIPAAVADNNLIVQWANKEALKRFPTLNFPNGFNALIQKYGLDKVMDCLKAGTVFTAGNDAEPLSLIAVKICPVMDSGRLLGSFVFFVCNKSSNQQPSVSYQEKLISAYTNEYKMPLTIIFSTLGLMSEYAQGNEPLKTYIKLIAQNSYRLLRVSDSISHEARLQTGLDDFNLRNGDICSFLTGLCKAAGILTMAINIPLKFDVPPKPVYTLFDPNKISCALISLISNACKFTRDGNQINIRMENRKNNIVITVSDRGSGIKPEIVDHIFEPYFSYGPEGRPYGSAGLGLTLVKNIIARHGGAIALHSIDSEGTTIAFTLPIRSNGKAPDYIAETSADYLSNRFSNLYVGLADVCGCPMP